MFSCVAFCSGLRFVVCVRLLVVFVSCIVCLVVRVCVYMCFVVWLSTFGYVVYRVVSVCFCLLCVVEVFCRFVC